MPIVTMPDGTPVMMPDKLDPATAARLRAFQDAQKFKEPAHQGAAHMPGPEPANVIGEVGDTAADVALGFAGLPADFGENVIDLGRAALGSVETAAGRPDLAPALSDRAATPGTTEWLQAMARKHGMIDPANDPTTPQGRTARTVLSGALGAAAGGRMGAPAAQSGREILSGALRQGAGGAASGLVAGIANEAPMDDSSRAMASTVASLLPNTSASARRAIQERIRKAIIGNTDVKGREATARRAGIDSPDPAAVTGSSALGNLEGAFARLPGAAGILDTAAERRQEGMRGRTQDVARGLNPGGPVDAERAGRALQEGVHGDVERMRSVQRGLYDKVSAVVPPATDIPLSNFRDALRRFAGPVEGAEATSAQLVPPKIKALFDALETDLAAVPTKPGGEAAGPLKAELGELPSTPRTPDEVGDYLMKILGKRDQISAAREKADSDAARAAKAREPVNRPVSTERRKDDHLIRLDREIQVRDAAPEGRAAKDSLPYQTVAGLRSQLGRLLESPSLLVDAPKNEYRALYRALSDDIRKALPPEAKQAWDRASNYTRAMHDRVDTVYEPLERAGTPEKAVKAAFSGTREGSSAFRKIMGATTPAQRNAVAAHVIEKMGTTRPGQQNVDGDRFSAETFLTNWNSMNDGARRALFPGRTYDDMKTVAEAASHMRDAGRGSYNPSGTARTVTHAGFYGIAAQQIVSSLLDLNPVRAARTAVAFGGEALVNRNVARALTSPKFVAWLADGTKPAAADAGSYVGRLQAIQKSERDPETADALAQLLAYIQPSPQPAGAR